MRAWDLVYSCVVRPRCPCCARGPLFDGVLRLRRGCPECGLLYEQWVGEWITPTCAASMVGMLVAFGLIGFMFTTGVGMHGSLPPELTVCLMSGAVALACLRPAKGLWLGFLYQIGGVEVSAQTRAYLRWWATRSGDDPTGERVRQADRRARSHRPLRPSAPARRVDPTPGG